MKDTSVIPSGTPCFLVGLAERAECIGRVVEIVRGPMSADDADDVYELTAPWIRESFRGIEAQARRANLRPILPPPLTAPAPAPAISEQVTG